MHHNSIFIAIFPDSVGNYEKKLRYVKCRTDAVWIWNYRSKSS